jgi:hypothetical protein
MSTVESLARCLGDVGWRRVGEKSMASESERSLQMQFGTVEPRRGLPSHGFRGVYSSCRISLSRQSVVCCLQGLLSAAVVDEVRGVDHQECDYHDVVGSGEV